MSLILVGDDKRCSVRDVVVTIGTSSPNINAAKLDTLMTILRTDASLRENIKRDLELKKELLPESLERVLEEWKSRVSTVASLDALVYVLKHCDLASSAEALRSKFYAKSNSHEKLTTTTYPGSGNFNPEEDELLTHNISHKFQLRDGRNLFKTMRQTLQNVMSKLFCCACLPMSAANNNWNK